MCKPGVKTALLGTVRVCLMAAMVPWSSISAQLGKPAPRQPTAPSLEVMLPDIASVVLYISPILLPGTIPSDPNLPSGVQGGREVDGSVTLRVNAPAGGAVIALLSGNTTLLRVPATVTVPAGASSVKFRYNLLPVSEPTTAMVTAVYNKLSKTGSVLILPPSIQTLTLDSDSVQGGKGRNGLVTLNGLGPTDRDIRVALASSHPAVEVPAELLLRGVQQKSFQIKTKRVGQPTPVLVSAAFAASKQEALLTVVPARLRNFGWFGYAGNDEPGLPAPIVWRDSIDCLTEGEPGPIITSTQNQLFKGMILLAAELDGEPPSGGSGAIQLTSSNSELVPVPATLTFAQNRVQTIVTCGTPVTETIVTVTGTYLGATRTYTVTVKP